MATRDIYELVTDNGADALMSLVTSSTQMYNPWFGNAYKRVSQITLSGQIIFDALLFNVKQGDGGARRAVIYANSGGVPGAKLYEGVDVTASVYAGGPRVLPFSQQITLPAGTYWIGYHNSSGGGYPYQTSGTYRYDSGGDTFGDGSSNPFGASNVTGAGAGLAFGFGLKKTIEAYSDGGLDPDGYYSYPLNPYSADTLYVVASLQLAAPAQITHVGLVSPVSGNPPVRAAIYSVTSGALRGQSNAFSTLKVGPNLIPLTAPVSLEAGNYYIAVLMSGTTILMPRASSGGGAGWATRSYGSGFPATMPTLTTLLWNLNFSVVYIAPPPTYEGTFVAIAERDGSRSGPSNSVHVVRA